MKDEDRKEIMEILRAEGLDAAEEQAVAAVNAGIDLLKLLLPKVSKWGSMFVIPMLEGARPLIMAQLDKIDGEDDPGY